MESALQGDCRRKRREIHPSPPPLSYLRLHSLRSVEPLWRREVWCCSDVKFVFHWLFFKPVEPVLNGQPVLSGQLAIPQG